MSANSSGKIIIWDRSWWWTDLHVKDVPSRGKYDERGIGAHSSNLAAMSLHCIELYLATGPSNGVEIFRVTRKMVKMITQHHLADSVGTVLGIKYEVSLHSVSTFLFSIKAVFSMRDVPLDWWCFMADNEIFYRNWVVTQTHRYGSKGWCSFVQYDNNLCVVQIFLLFTPLSYIIPVPTYTIHDFGVTLFSWIGVQNKQLLPPRKEILGAFLHWRSGAFNVCINLVSDELPVIVALVFSELALQVELSSEEENPIWNILLGCSSGGHSSLSSTTWIRPFYHSLVTAA